MNVVKVDLLIVDSTQKTNKIKLKIKGNSNDDNSDYIRNIL